MIEEICLLQISLILTLCLFKTGKVAVKPASFASKTVGLRKPKARITDTNNS